jgi:CDP-diacylglycerol--glycerol-3-phosphate 3-phosphatidyltransferase
VDQPNRRFRIRTLPNAITGARIVLAPLTLAAHQLGAEGSATWLGVTLVGLVLAELSDATDGAVARATGQTSDVGKLLDPLSDSLFRMFVFLGFLTAGWMPLWMAAVLFARDIWVAYLRVFSGLQNIVLAARISGKNKAIAQAVAQIGAVVLYLGVATGWWGDAATGVAWWLLLGATLVTAWSWVDYTVGVLGAIEIE